MPSPLFDRLAHHVSARPNATALSSLDATVSWSELSARLTTMAAGLRERGVTAGEPVALVMGNHVEFVVGLLAILRAGAVAVPLAADSKEPEIGSALARSGARTLLADDKRLALCARGLASGGLQRAFVRGSGAGDVCGLDALSATIPTTDFEPPSPDAPALEQASSGTSGVPKRVLRTHAQLAAEAEAFAVAAATTADDRILAVIPLHHAHGLANALLASLHAGAALYLRARFDRRETLRLLADERITIFPTVPFMVAILADTRLREAIDLSAMRLCFSAGAPLPRATFEKVRARLGIDVRQLYGSTETGALSLQRDPDAARHATSVGTPLPGVEIAILSEAGAALPPESEGDVAVRGPAAATQWLVEGAAVPLADADGWIHLGDRGRVDATGNLTITGRNALFINVAGRKVDPAEVEAALAEFPAVREAVVLPTRDPYGETTVRAVLVVDGDADKAEILRHCRERLADYKVPSQLEFRTNLPRGSTGKTDRRALQETA